MEGFEVSGVLPAPPASGALSRAPEPLLLSTLGVLGGREESQSHSVVAPKHLLNKILLNRTMPDCSATSNGLAVPYMRQQTSLRYEEGPSEYPPFRTQHSEPYSSLLLLRFRV